MLYSLLFIYKHKKLNIMTQIQGNKTSTVTIELETYEKLNLIIK